MSGPSSQGSTGLEFPQTRLRSAGLSSTTVVKSVCEATRVPDWVSPRLSPGLVS